MTLEELRIVISASTEPLRKEMNNVKKQLNGVEKETAKTTSGIQNLFKKLLVGVVALKIGQKIGQAITGGIREAMNVEAALQQIKRIMGESSNQFLKWADTQAIAFNMSKGQAARYGSIFGNLVSGFSKSTAEINKNTTDLLKASSIIASSTGRTMEDVMERIRSGLLGNTEAIEDLGVNVNVAMIESTEAFKKFANGKSWNQLNFQTQQQIRLMAILEQTSKKYGDTVNQNTSTQLAQLVAHLNNVKLSLGQAFLPIVQIILPSLTALAERLSYIMNLLAQFSQALFGSPAGGKQAQNTNTQAKAMTGLGNATEKAGKQAKGALAGFDEINSLSLGDSGSGADGSETGSPLDATSLTMGNMGINFETNAPDVSSKIQEMADNVKGKFKEITDFIADNKEIILSVLAGLAASIIVLNIPAIISGITAAFAALSGVIAMLLSPLGLIALGIGLLIGSFVYLYQTNEDFRNNINAVWEDISNTFNSFINDTIKPIFDYLVNDFLVPLGKAFKDYILPVLAELFVGVGQILDDILNLLTSTIDNLWDIVKPAVELIKKIVIDLLEIIKSLWDKYGKDLIENVRNFIKGLQETFQLLWDNIIDPIIKPALEMLTWLWDKHLKGLIEQVGDFVMKCVNGALEIYNGFIKPILDWLITYLGPGIATVISFIIDLFGSFLGGISDIIKGLFQLLGGLVDFIVGVFTLNWEKAWQGVKDIFGGIFESLWGLVKTILNYVIDGINAVIRGLNKIKVDIPDWVSKITGISGTWGININTIPKLAKGGITNGEMIATIGDNPGGREVVSPLSDLMGMITTAVNNVIPANQSNSQTNRPVILILKVDKSELGRVTIDSINDIIVSSGEMPLKI